MTSKQDKRNDVVRMTDEAAEALRREAADLQRTADELRVKLHLASADARDHWYERIEPQLTELERKIDVADGASRDLANELRASLSRFAERIGVGHSASTEMR